MLFLIHNFTSAQGDPEPSAPTPLPPPYRVLVPNLPRPANSSTFHSRGPTARLPRSQSSDQLHHGALQYDIHGDVIVEQMLPVPVTVPQPPQSKLSHCEFGKQ